MHSVDAFLISPKHKGYEIKEDHIFIFLNYKQLFKTKSKKDAILYIDKLINEAPVESKIELELHKDYLIRSIR